MEVIVYKNVFDRNSPFLMDFDKFIGNYIQIYTK